MTDEELKALVASLAISQKETDQKMRETDQRIKELTEQGACEMQAFRESLEKSHKETDEAIKKTDDAIKKLSKLMGSHSNNQGKVVEEFFYRGLEKTLTLGGIQFSSIYRNFAGHKGQVQDEFDIVLVNGDCMMLIETKFKAHPKDIDRLVSRKIPNFRVLFPGLSKEKIYGALATLSTFDDLVDKARDEGIFLLTQCGDHVEIVNQNVIAR